MIPNKDSKHDRKEENYKNVGKLNLFCIMISLGWGSMGYSYAIYNPTISYISYTLEWEKSEIPLRQALGYAMLPLSALISLTIVSWKFYNSSRRRQLLTADILTILGSFMTTIPIFWLFLLGRAFIGLAIGINGPVGFSFIREISPVAISGKLTSHACSVSTACQLLVFVLAFLLPSTPSHENSSWRILYLVPAILSLTRIIFLGIFYKFDTPKYYLLQDKEKEARKVFSKIYSEGTIDKAIGSVRAESETEKRISLKMLRKEYQMQLIISSILVALSELTGQQTITSYSTSILTGASVDLDLSDSKNLEIKIVNLVMGIILVLLAIIGSSGVDKEGRKNSLIRGTFIQASGLIVLAGALQLEIPVLADVMLLLFSIGMAMGLGQISLIYCSEVLPVKGFSLMLMLDNLINLLFNFAFPLLASIQGFNFSGILYVMGVISILGLIPIVKLVKETKGATTREIFEAFKEPNQILQNGDWPSDQETPILLDN